MPEAHLNIRAAIPADCPLILELIRDLAKYEKMSNLVVASSEDIQQAIFSKPQYAHCLIAQEGDQPVGFALYFFNFSTFQGKPGLYLEDLYIKAAYRGHGYGKALLKKLAGIALERNCRRMDWAVLDWNQPAIDFYYSIWARAEDEWTTFRLDGNALNSFATTEK